MSTLLLLTVVVVLLVGLYDQKRRQALLLDRLSYYRNLRDEGIYDALKLPGGSLIYLDDVAVGCRTQEDPGPTTKNPKVPKLTAGIPIYVDPLGLQEAEVSLNSRVKRPPSADTPTLGEHLARILDSLGLVYLVKDGFLMVTKESPDGPVVEHGPVVEEEKNLYLRYRDVLE